MRTRLLALRSVLCLVLLACAVAACAQAPADWPCWRGPAHSGVSAESGWGVWGAEGPKIAWRAQVGYGFSACAVAGDRVVTMGNTGDVDTVFCFAAPTGQLLWKHTYDCPREPLAYEGGPNASPLIDGERVYTLSKFGHVHCLDAATGAVVWQRKFERSPAGPDDYRVDWGFAGSPLVVGNRLILAIGPGGLALDKTTGATLWDSGPGRAGYSSPVPYRSGDRDAFARLSGHELIGSDVATGEILWRLPWKTTWDQNASDVVIEGGKLFAVTGHGVGGAQYDLSTTPPTELWRNKHLRTYLSPPVLWQGNLYGFTEEGGQLRCLDWATGDLRWSAPGLGQGSLIVVDGKLVVLGEKGTLVVAEATPEAYRPLAQAEVLSGRCWIAPTFAHRRLYLRNAAGELVCVQLPEA